MDKIKIYTIGFTKKTAEQFFNLIQKAGVKRVIDIRLNNNSQLAGYSKKDDLRYFLRTISNIEYVHMPDLASTEDMLDEYKKKKGGWQLYEKKFLDLMSSRKIEDKVSQDILENSCLLCSEDKPHHCHRRLVAEYLNQKWGNLEITHLS